MVFRNGRGRRAGWERGPEQSPRVVLTSAPSGRGVDLSVLGGNLTWFSGPPLRVSTTQLHASIPALCPDFPCSAGRPAAHPASTAPLFGAQQVGGPVCWRRPLCGSCARPTAASGTGTESWGAAALAESEPHQSACSPLPRGSPSSGPALGVSASAPSCGTGHTSRVESAHHPKLPLL